MRFPFKRKRERSLTKDEVKPYLELFEEKDFKPAANIDLKPIVETGRTQLFLSDFYEFQKNALDFSDRIPNKRLYAKIMRFLFKRAYQEMIINLWVFEPYFASGKYYIREMLTDKAKKRYKIPFWISWKSAESRKNQKKYLFHKYKGHAKDRTGIKGLNAEVRERENHPHKKNYSAYIE